jgi:hypothetical protein
MQARIVAQASLLLGAGSLAIVSWLTEEGHGHGAPASNAMTRLRKYDLPAKPEQQPTGDVGAGGQHAAQLK